MKHAPELEYQLLEQMRCPVCGGLLASSQHDPEDAAEARCVSCESTYPRTDGIWRMLTDAEQQRYKSFLEGYPAVRRREGREADPAYFLAPPDEPPRDLTALAWNIRRRSLRTLNRLLAEEIAAGRALRRQRWALDLGAGNGWLSRHLADLDYRTVALDLTVAGVDSLAGARLYMERDRIWLGRIQASMSQPPLCDGAFDLCTISAALHYADVEATLRSVHRLLRPRGLLIITDSPVYSCDRAGRTMAAEREAQIEAVLGSDAPRLPGGQNYLVESQLVDIMRRLGFARRSISIERPLGRLKRTLLRVARPGRREQARFPVIAARKVVH